MLAHQFVVGVKIINDFAIQWNRTMHVKAKKTFTKKTKKNEKN